MIPTKQEQTFHLHETLFTLKTNLYCIEFQRTEHIKIMQFSFMETQVRWRFWQERGRSTEACFKLPGGRGVSSIPRVACRYTIESGIPALRLGIELLAFSITFPF